MSLIAPDHITGRMHKHTPQELRDERSEWALTAGQAGHSTYAVGEALGISQNSARTIMIEAGWVWHGALAITFTHWMPLPAAPSQAQGV